MDQALKTMIDNMPEKTGKSLEGWKMILLTESFKKHGEAVKFLKTDHGVSHGYANTIVTLARDNNESPNELVDNQYKGKEELKPIYEKLIKLVEGLGTEVKVTPKKSSVSIIRKKQFALIKPATQKRIDLGLKLTGKDLTKRLENSGPFGTMCTHRVQLSSVEHIDEELKNWLIEAYEKAK
ncbi:MAG: DUF4287 domain-containing protein [Candidatus Marinimicrobia bacterium]|nr:DUF4287 domain-containing protein [Candidatus Neomarinimicrobiota bacterium]